MAIGVAMAWKAEASWRRVSAEAQQVESACKAAPGGRRPRLAIKLEGQEWVDGRDVIRRRRVEVRMGRERTTCREAEERAGVRQARRQALDGELDRGEARRVEGWKWKSEVSKRCSNDGMGRSGGGSERRG
jgi:hypothetical protein